MHDEERTLTDRALDDEIARALSVEPSPEFLAKVRTRIDDEPAPSAWRFGWMMAAAAAVAAAIVVAVVVERSAAPVTPVQPLAARSLAWNANVPGAPQKNLESFPVPRGSTGSPRATYQPARPELVEGRAQRAVDNELQPLIDPREKAALQSLIARVRVGRVDLSPVLRASAPTAMDLPPVTDIVIAPLSIESLAPIDGAEGVRQ